MVTTDSINRFKVEETRSRNGLGYTPKNNVITASGITVKSSLELISGRLLYFSLAGPKNIL